jgi:hypothetical protein
MTTQPAGQGLSDAEAIAEVAAQTDPNVKAEAVFEREHNGASTDTPAAELEADEVQG